MEYEKKFTKQEAIDNAEKFLAEVRELEKKYSTSFNSDTGDIYLTHKSSEKGEHWGNVKIGWEGDGTGLKVMEKSRADLSRKIALAKLTKADRVALGLDEEEDDE